MCWLHNSSSPRLWNVVIQMERKMNLVPVNLEDLSSIRHRAQIESNDKSGGSEFLHIAFHGVYRDGHEGKSDAQYLMAIVAAYDSAFHANAFIIDLCSLVYQWGDEMHCIWDIGYERWCRCHRPLAIIVSESCAPALRSLDSAEFERFAVTSFDEALASIRRQRTLYDACLRDSDYGRR